jgi:rhamnosyl/mannosyltransferase
MRVLHIYKDYAPVVGGIENHIRLLAAAQHAAGVQTHVLVTNTTPRTEQIVVDGVPVTKAGRLLNVSSAPVSLAFYPLLYRLEQGVDIVHAHLPYPPGELGHLLVGRSRRLVLTYHSDIVRQKVLGALYTPFLWELLRRADRIAVSNPAYVRSSRFLAAYPEKCRVIPFGVNLNDFAATPAIRDAAAAIRQRFAPDRPLLLFVGRLRHYKGLDVLIAAMPQIEAHLLVIGSGPLEAIWRQQAVTAGVADRVTFWGERPDLDKIAALHAADLFVLPSTNRAESFGIVLIEALAAGLPLVSTELGTGTSFVNQHEVTGLVTPPNDPAALAAAVNRITRDPDLRGRMAAAALARARAEFDQALMVTRVQALYDETLALGRTQRVPAIGRGKKPA